MSKLRQRTIDTYNQSAQELAEYFRGIGPRVDDIDKALELAGSPRQPNIIEIGCGDGRDAKEIVERAASYVGFDISEELIKLARQHVPKADFRVADVANFEFPKALDVVYSFASLLHSDKDEMSDVLQRVGEALKAGGVFCISLKQAAQYEEMIKKDQFGERLFYLYTPEMIQQLAGSVYETAQLKFTHIGNTDWFEIMLRKP